MTLQNVIEHSNSIPGFVCGWWRYHEEIDGILITVYVDPRRRGYSFVDEMNLTPIVRVDLGEMESETFNHMGLEAVLAVSDYLVTAELDERARVNGK